MLSWVLGDLETYPKDKGAYTTLAPSAKADVLQPLHELRETRHHSRVERGPSTHLHTHCSAAASLAASASDGTLHSRYCMSPRRCCAGIRTAAWACGQSILQLLKSLA